MNAISILMIGKTMDNIKYDCKKELKIPVH
jgi:hypothetical protein